MEVHKLDRNQYDSQNSPNNPSSALDIIGTKVPPNSPEAEAAVMGALMLSRQSFSRVINIINGECFYNPAHQMIFGAVQELFENNLNVDILTLSEQLKKSGNLKSIGGNLYLAELNRRTPSAANIEQYAMIVLEKYLKRQLIESAGDILTRAYDDTNEAMDEIDRAEQAIFKLAEKRFSKSFFHIKELAHDTYELISKLSKQDGIGVTGVPTGFTKLDEMLGGLQNSDLIIVAARPSMGKTALGLSIALNIGLYHKTPLAFFSLEMASTQIAIRLISGDAQIDQQRIRNGGLKESDHKKIVKSLGRLSDSPIIIDDSGMLNILELRAKCRRLKAEHGIKLVIVDYLQLLSAPKAESREREISIISQTLKQIAKELELPVLALAQLNRSVESRPGKDKRPMLSDLRESGSIEQDADVVMFVNRPERYGIKEFEDGTPTENMAEIIIGKQRNGPVGTVRLAFQKDYARFMNPMIMAEHQPHSGSDAHRQHLDNISNIPSNEDDPF